MWEIFARKHPYYFLEDNKQIIPYVMKNGRPDLEDCGTDIDNSILDLIEQNWDENPDNRMEF